MSFETESEDKFTDAQLVELLREEGKSCSSVASYLSSLEARYEVENLYAFLVGVSDLLDPKDPLLGGDEEKPIGTAFRTGAVLGMRIIEHACYEDPRIFASFLASGFTPQEPQAGEEHLLAESWIESSQMAYEDLEQFHDLVEGWEDQAIPEVSYQRYYRAGFGWVFGVYEQFSEAYTEAERDWVIQEEINRALKEGVNWDEELAGLLGNPDSPQA